MGEVLILGRLCFRHNIKIGDLYRISIENKQEDLQAQNFRWEHRLESIGIPIDTHKSIKGLITMWSVEPTASRTDRQPP